MTVPGVSCKAVATQNSSEWPCSMCPFPQLRLVGVRTSYIHILVFPGHLEFWTPLQIPIWGPPLGCVLLHQDSIPFRPCPLQDDIPLTPAFPSRYLSPEESNWPQGSVPLRKVIALTTAFPSELHFAQAAFPSVLRFASGQCPL